MILSTRSLLVGLLVIVLIYMFVQQRQLSKEIELVKEKSKRQEIQTRQIEKVIETSPFDQQQQQCAAIQRERDDFHRKLEKLTKTLEETENRLEAALQKEKKATQALAQQQQQQQLQEQQQLQQQLQQQQQQQQEPSPSVGKELGAITVTRFDGAKFGLRWLKSLSDEERDHAILSVLKRSARTPVEFPSTTGTSWNCYALSEEAIANTFPPFEKFATGNVCVFENLCFFDRSYQVIADATSHPNHRLTSNMRFNWPQCLNGAQPTTTVHMVSDAQRFLSDPKVEWVEDFSWMITNSYSRHTAHWMETISQIFIARKYLGSDIVPPASRVYLANHNDMFDWQKGTLLTSLLQEEETKIYYPDALNRGADRPICFRKAALPGYQFYFFTSRDVGIAYKYHVYQTLGLAQPKTIPKVITLASRGGKRSITNEAELVAFMRASLPDIEVRVVKFGTMSFREQVTSMQESGILVGIHGADLTNLMFLPVGGTIIEVNPYRWYDNRFFGLAPVTGVEYFSYNCGKASCSSSGAAAREMVQDWPISGYPPATNNDCRQEQVINGRRDSNVKVDFDDFGYVLREVYGFLGWGPKVPTSTWN